MADTLLFRGGSSADIASSTVQNRELVIDTDTDQIVTGTAKKKTVMEDASGNAKIHGTLEFGDGSVQTTAATGGGGGAVDSVNGQTGVVVLDASDVGAVPSDPTGVTGADSITNMMSLTQAEYDAIGTPNASTLYIITP